MTEDEMVRWHHHHSMDMSLRKLRELVIDREGGREGEKKKTASLCHNLKITHQCKINYASI